MMSKLLMIKIHYLLFNSAFALRGHCNCKFSTKAIWPRTSCEHPSYGNNGIIVRNKAITSDSFKGLVHLRCLRLQENGISEIKPEMFQGLNSLKLLTIQNNKLNNIENGTFKYLASLTELNLSYNCLENVYSGSFLGLKSLKHLTLSHNRLYQLQPGSFQHLTSLHQLVLSENCIQKVHAQSFLGLKLLKILRLSKNKLEVLSVETFLGLMSVKCLHLSQNKLTHLTAESFTYQMEGAYLTTPSNRQVSNKSMRSVEPTPKVDLSKNYLTEIHFTFFSMLHSLTHIVLSFNLIGTCELAYLKEIVQIDLDNNKLSLIHKVMFKGLISLQRLHLENNHIQIIVSKAFKDLKNLKELHLNGNNLTWLPKEFIADLTALQMLKLQNNPIQIIEKGAFHRTHSFEKLVIYMSGKNITALDLTWQIYSKSPFNTSSLAHSKQNFEKTELIFCEEIDKCVASLCWIKQLKTENIFDIISYDYDYKNILIDKCAEFDFICQKKGIKSATFNSLPENVIIRLINSSLNFSSFIFTEKGCMNGRSAECIYQCLSMGYPDGNLAIHKYICPFQYFCNCTCNNCAEKCALVGKVHVNKDVDIFGCAICNCQCGEINCYKACKRYNFEKANNTYGCLECNCTCPHRDCNAPCQGEGNGLVTYDTEGCMVCNGCRYEATKENNKVVLVPVLLLSLLIMCSALILVFYILRRNQRKENSSNQKQITTSLNILTQNLDPEVAQQVKESWYEPKALRVNHMLGNGQFGIVWSAILEKSLGKKFQVAVKVAKAEYKDVWAVDTKWNSKHELKPHFEKRRVQIKLDNQVVEDLLMEALIMKKFSHSNVLNMIGISMFEDKPCIILPLMHNGDLKKYLLTNKSRLANPDLGAFALGVVKGMVYLAEQKFVHCDLAARNCMLDADLMVKISDFGLTRDINTKGSYKEDNTKTVVPIRWMSTEAIKFGKFTLQSDMWSLGVVVWEIFSCGELPYKGIENTDILEFLMNGNRLQKPKMCPDSMYDIMLKCWNKDPEKRPSAYVMLDIVNRIADEESNYTEVKDEPVEAQTNYKIMECSTQVKPVVTK